MNTINCLLDGSRGIYIPEHFVTFFDAEAWNVNPDDALLLKLGPESEFYWETWDRVLDDAMMTDEDTGHVWRLYQDGDLFAVRDDHNFED